MQKKFLDYKKIEFIHFHYLTLRRRLSTFFEKKPSKTNEISDFDASKLSVSNASFSGRRKFVEFSSGWSKNPRENVVLAADRYSMKNINKFISFLYQVLQIPLLQCKPHLKPPENQHKQPFGLKLLQFLHGYNLHLKLL